MALCAGASVGPMVVAATAQTVPTIESTTTTVTERPTTTTRPATTTTTSRRTTTTTSPPATATTTTPSSSDPPSTSSTLATTTSTTAAGGATTSVSDSTTTTGAEGEIDPITNRQLVPTTTVPVGLDVGNPARISPIFPWLSVLGFLAAIGIVAAQYFLTGRRS